MKQLKIISAALLILLLAFSAGCSSGREASQSEQQNDKITANGQNKPETAAADKKQIKKIKITIYFPDENGQKLIASERTADVSKDDKYTAALKALLQGPGTGEGIAVIPKNTRLLGVSVNDKGIAEVNFDSALTKNFTGGSTGEIMLVGSIVDTLTDFQEVKAVRFFVDGKPLDTLSGHLDLTSPVARMKNIL